MNAKEFYEQICNIKENNDDIEGCHWKMDCLMCEVLEELGYQDGVKVFRDAPKWYS